MSPPGYPLLDFQSLRSRSSAGLGITFPDLFDTRTFSPSSVYMYLILHGLLVESKKSNITQNRWRKYQYKGINCWQISPSAISWCIHWYEAVGVRACNSAKNYQTCTAYGAYAHKPLLIRIWAGVLFLIIWPDYWSYMLLLKLPVLMWECVLLYEAILIWPMKRGSSPTPMWPSHACHMVTTWHTVHTALAHLPICWVH